MPKFKGLGFLWGISASMTGTGTSASWKFRSMSMDRSATVEERYDPSTSEVIGLVITNKKLILDAEVVLSSATVALMKDGNVIPDVGAQISVIDNNEKAGNELLQGAYYCLSAKKVYQAGSDVVLQMQMAAYINDAGARIALADVA